MNRCRTVVKKLLVFLCIVLFAFPYILSAQNLLRPYGGRGPHVRYETKRIKKVKYTVDEKDLLYYINIYPSLTVKNFYNDANFKLNRYFSWSTSQKNAAMYSPENKRKNPVRFAGQNFSSAVLYFQGGSFTRLHVTLFNAEKDSGSSYSRKTFERMLDDMTAILSLFVRQNPVEDKEQVMRHQFDNYCLWNIPGGILKLSWSNEKNKMDGASYCFFEFLSNTAGTKKSIPASRADSFTAGKNFPQVNTKALYKNVKKEKAMVYICNLPGAKNTRNADSITASLQRVLFYYGEKQNRSKLNRLARIKPSRRVSYGSMYGRLKNYSRILDMRIRREYEFFGTVSDLEKFVTRYNSNAKKEKQEKIRIEKYGERINMAKTFLTVEPELGRTSFLQMKKRGFEKTFCEFIKEKIDAGIPVLWSVLIDFSPEETSGQRGGYMRLITGYETGSGSRRKGKKSAQGFSHIIYSDPFSESPDLKKMSATDAWAITTGLYFAEKEK